MDFGAGIGMGLLWALLPAVIFLLVLWWIDKYEKEPFGFLGIAVLFGMLALGLAATLQGLLGLPVGLYPHSFVLQANVNPYGPLIEEAAKTLALLVVVAIVARELDGILDGIIYGAALGAGFALVQNFSFFFSVYSQYAGLTNLGWPTFVSVFIGGLNHSFYAAVVGGAIAYWKTHERPRRPLWAPFVAFLVAAGLHILHDYMPQLLQPLTASWPSGSILLLGLLWNAANWIGIALMALVVAWAWGKETLVISQYLADEVPAGVVTPDDYSILTSSLRRMLFEAECLVTRGLRAWWRQRALYDLEVELAFHKWHLASGRSLKGHQKSMQQDDYRARIRALRVQLPAMGGVE